MNHTKNKRAGCLRRAIPLLLALDGIAALAAESPPPAPDVKKTSKQLEEVMKLLQQGAQLESRDADGRPPERPVPSPAPPTPSTKPKP